MAKKKKIVENTEEVSKLEENASTTLNNQIVASNEKISNTTKRHLLSFIKDQNVTSKELFDMALYFPAKATKSLIGSGIINATL